MLKPLEPGSPSGFWDGGRQLTVDAEKPTVVVQTYEEWGDIAWRSYGREVKLGGK